MANSNVFIVDKDDKLEAMAPVVSRIAHDYNNFLAAVEGYAELILRELPQDSQNAQDVKEIKLSCEKMAAENKKLLSFARRRPPVKEKVNLSDLISEYTPFVCKNFENRKIDIKTENVFLDASVDQVRDLLSALIEYSHRCSTTEKNIEIGCKYEDSSPCLYVKYSGNVIGESDLPHIFYPYKSSGEKDFGLAIAYGIAVRHNAFFKIKSDRQECEIDVIFRGI